jgi:hypothetical protein
MLEKRESLGKTKAAQWVEERECKRRIMVTPRPESRSVPTITRPQTPPLDAYLRHIMCREAQHLELPPGETDIVRFLESPPSSPVPLDWHARVEPPPISDPDAYGLRIDASGSQGGCEGAPLVANHVGTIVFAPSLPIIRVDNYR